MYVLLVKDVISSSISHDEFASMNVLKKYDKMEEAIKHPNR